MDTLFNKTKFANYIILLLIILIIYISFLIIKPFIVVILTSILLAYIFFPVYKFLYKKTKRKNISSFIATIIVLLVFLIPILFIANALLIESTILYNKVKTLELGGVQNFIQGYLPVEISQYVETGIKRASLFIVNSVSDFVFSLPAKILNFFIMIFVLFYMFKDGQGIVKAVKDILPISFSKKLQLNKEINNITFSVIYGLGIASLVQGAIGGLGFLIFKVSNPILWGVIMALLAMIPLVGPAFIWVPAGIAKILSGDLFNGIGILIFGVLIISTVDNIIKPKIIGTRANIHPVVIFLGLIGGLKLIGFVGVILGPLILSLFLSFIRIIRSDHHEIKS